MAVPKRLIVLSAAGALLALATADALHPSTMTPPDGYSIFLEPEGSPHHEDSKREVCAARLQERHAWWIAVAKESSLYAEVRSSKTLQFELDAESGVSNVCVSEEFDARTRPDIVKAVLEGCGRTGSIAKDLETQVVLHLRARSQSGLAPWCETPNKTARLPDARPDAALNPPGLQPAG